MGRQRTILFSQSGPPEVAHRPKDGELGQRRDAEVEEGGEEGASGEGAAQRRSPTPGQR